MGYKTLKHFRRKGYSFPLIAWFFNLPLIYLLVFAVGLAGAGGMIYTGVNSFENIKAPLPDQSPYQTIALQSTPSELWARELVKENPLEGPWNVSAQELPRQPLSFNECSALGLMEETVTGTYQASNENFRVTVLTYTAGEAHQGFQLYEEALSECFNTTTLYDGDPSTELLTYPSGFAFSYGDAIVFGHFSKEGVDQQLLASYMESTAATLLESGCVALTYTDDPTERNLFLYPEEYRGYIKQEKVETTLNLGNLPDPKYQEVLSFEAMQEPEGPLPEDFPTMPSEEPEYPIIPAMDLTSRPDFVKEYSYQVPDSAGPGCGWEWSGLHAPLVDADELESMRKASRYNTQVAIDDEAANWISAKITSAAQATNVMTTVDDWNHYVKAVLRVQDRWRWLNDERTALWSPWLSYVEAHDAWLNFNGRKANAARTYENELEVCEAANDELVEWQAAYDEHVEAWEEREAERRREWEEQPDPTPPPEDPAPPGDDASVTATPEPTPEPPAPTKPPFVPEPLPEFPDPPEGCTSPPARPAILDQERGPEPEAPTIPEGVTLPASWPEPLTTPTVRVEEND